MSDTASISSQNSSRSKNYVCDFNGCDKAYAKPSLLDQHKRSHTGERPFKCSYSGCTKLFLRKSHLLAHTVSHKDQVEKPYHCSICGKGVNSPQHLKRHEITHTRSFKCPNEGCDEAFYKHQSLRHHILMQHEKKLTCPICNKAFSRPYRLAQHNIKYHSETPTYQCDYKGCFKDFKTWSALQLHIKTDHPKLKCTICGKGCVGKLGLMSHMITHDEDRALKLWNCEYCNLGKFPKKSELVKHYHDYHDGNLPETLLKPEERLHLARMLQETDNNVSLEALKSQGYMEVPEPPLPERASGTATPTQESSLRSIDSLNIALSQNSGSIIDMLLKNYPTKKLSCPKQKCGRHFSKDYDLQRHLKWHEEHAQKILEFLASLEENMNHPPDTNDDTFNEMIDDELKKLKQDQPVN